MNALLDVILPVFLVIGFGWTAVRARLFSDVGVDMVMRFAQNFAVPCLLFRSIATLDLGQSFDLRLFGAFYPAAFAAFAVGCFGARFVFGRPWEDAIAIGFCSYFSNSLLLGLPITERAYGTAALAGNYAIISIHSPLLYTLAISAMEMVRSHGRGLSKPRLMLQVLRGVFSNPLVIGISIGVVVNLSGLPVPGMVMSAVEMMARAAIPAALFGLGGVLYRYRPEGDMKVIAMVCACSLLLHPGLTWLLGRHVFDLSEAQMRSAVMTAAMAPGVNAYLFADLYGRARRVAASAVLIATALSILTIWGWLHLLP